MIRLPIHTSWQFDYDDVLIDLYLNLEIPAKDLEPVFGVCSKTLRKQLRRLNIIRERDEVTRLSWKCGAKKYNPISIRKGIESSNWKGGRFYDSKGYVLIYVGEGGRYNNRYDYEHVLVWEKTHGKRLSEDYLIHHLNGIRDDNRPENLVALKRINHSTWTLIKVYQGRIKELENKIMEMNI